MDHILVCSRIKDGTEILPAAATETCCVGEKPSVSEGRTDHTQTESAWQSTLSSPCRETKQSTSKNTSFYHTRRL